LTFQKIFLQIHKIVSVSNQNPTFKHKDKRLWTAKSSMEVLEKKITNKAATKGR